MKCRNIISNTSFLLIFLGIACGTGSDPKEKEIWMEVGNLEQESLEMEYAEGHLFAATNTGIFRCQIISDNPEWVKLGLEISSDTSEIGDVLYVGEELYGVKRNIIDFSKVPKDYNSIYKSSNLGDEWNAISIELEDRERPYVINRIAKGNDGVLFADWHLIFKSSDYGKTWKNLSKNNRVGVSEFLYVSSAHPHQVWTGGWTNINTPYLSKSEDGGESWTTLNEKVFFDAYANAYTVVISPASEETVLAGFGGTVSPANVIRKSEDGGETWQTVLEGYNIRTLQNSVQHTNRVYASGISETGMLFVAISNNYGDSWEVKEYEDGPGDVLTNDMVVTEVNGSETLYFATASGVYSFTFEE